MKIEVLVATMHAKDNFLVDKMNIKSDALIINQCDFVKYEQFFKNDKYKIRKFSNAQRGLSRSRNEALLNAEGDICLIADDDMVYKDNYVESVKEAFEKLPDADIIVFNTTMLNNNSQIQRKDFEKIRKAPKYKNYGSVRIAFKRESFLNNNIWFNVKFGAGSVYASGEESLMLRDANKKKLKIYEYPANIADVDYAQSTWFEGYNEKFFMDKGAFLSKAYPKAKSIMKYYYLFRFRNVTTYKKSEILKFIKNGYLT